MAQPTTYDNPLTRMIERAHQRNAGEARREVPVDAGASPSARSAAVGREVMPPLSVEERAELDAKARELGVLPSEEGVDNPYPTLADAMKAGSAVEGPPPPVEPVRQTASQASPRTVAGVRLPDFTKVGGIDLIRDVVYVDSMEFPISKEDADQFRLYAIQVAHNVITQKLNEAVTALSIAVTEATGGGDEAVSSVQGDETKN